MDIIDFISAVRDTRRKIGIFGLKRKYARGLADLAETLLIAESQRRTVTVNLFKNVRAAVEGLRDLPVKGKKAERRRDSFLKAAEKQLILWEGKPLPVEEKNDAKEQHAKTGPTGVIRGGLDGIRPRSREGG